MPFRKQCVLVESGAARARTHNPPFYVAIDLGPPPPWSCTNNWGLRRWMRVVLVCEGGCWLQQVQENNVSGWWEVFGVSGGSIQQKSWLTTKDPLLQKSFCRPSVLTYRQNLFSKKSSFVKVWCVRNSSKLLRIRGIWRKKFYWPLTFIGKANCDSKLKQVFLYCIFFYKKEANRFQERKLSNETNEGNLNFQQNIL